MLLGSQIQLLEALNAVYPLGLARPNLDTYRVRDRLDWTFDQFISFLITTQLVERVEDKDDYRLTEYGRGYLQYTAWQMLPAKLS